MMGCSLFSCTKPQEEFYPQNKVIDININGYIAADSLQFKLGDKIVEASEDGASLYFQGSVSTRRVFNGPVTFSMFDSKGVKLMEQKIDATVLSNSIKFYYDGASLIDKLPPIPKPTPGNAGMLVNFPERKYSKIPAKDILVEVTLAKRGQPTIKKAYPFNDEGSVFIDMNVPPIYTSMAFRLMKAASPAEPYLDNSKSSNFILTPPKADKGYLVLIKEYADTEGTLLGVQGVELTQYLQ